MVRHRSRRVGGEARPAVRICAGGVLVRGEELLLARRSDDREFYPGVWDVVGGHCEEGEAPADALVREVEEEIGVVPRVFREVAVLGEPRPGTHGEAEYHIFRSPRGAAASRGGSAPSTPICAG